MSAVMSFARFHLLHYMSMGFMRIETTVICLAALGRVVHVLTVGFEWHCDTSLHHFVFFWYEPPVWTLLRIACQDVRHASWGNMEFSLDWIVGHLSRYVARILG